MKYTVVIRASAQVEAADAFLWYEDRSEGLGARFATALKACFDLLAQNPKGLQIREGRFRHMVVPKFPYRVVFTIDGNTVYVYQIRHTSRKPSKRFGP